MPYLSIFRQLCAIPRPSHHEGRVADFLCQFAEVHHLRYRRDANNCVVIEKPATPGHEDAEPVVILNHMDMVCVARDDYRRDGRPFDPLRDAIRPYIDTVTDAEGKTTRWMKAEGTSLGADNGMGLSMALAILADDTIVHGPLEVLTTTNEEDGMSGAEGLATDFIRGRKVINLDSEAYDEITVGAAGAYLQKAHWTLTPEPVSAEGYDAFTLSITGGLGGHSGVDINKGRCNAIHTLAGLIAGLADDVLLSAFDGGTANASIASAATATLLVPESRAEATQQRIDACQRQMAEQYGTTDPSVRLDIVRGERPTHHCPALRHVVATIAALPCGVISMRSDMPGTVMTSNNIGVAATAADGRTFTLTCHSRSFDNDDMRRTGRAIAEACKAHHAAHIDLLMDTAAWVERPDAPLLSLTSATFRDVLGFAPKPVAMHFVLEAAYYVEKYPGVEIASIGPRIVEPHSTSERVDLDTAADIWRVTIALLSRLA